MKVIENPENVGFAAANNQALRMARGEYLVLLNPDTEVRAGAIGKLVEVLDPIPRSAHAAPCWFHPTGVFSSPRRGGFPTRGPVCTGFPASIDSVTVSTFRS